MAALAPSVGQIAKANANGSAAVEQADTPLPLGFARESAKIFTPVQVGAFTLSNRLIHGALGLARSIDGSESRLAPIYFDQRATLGSLVISQATGVDPAARAWPYAAELDTEENIEALSLTIDAVHKKGAYWFQQLFHVGRSTSPALVRLAREEVSLWDAPDYGWRPVSASEVAETGINTHSGEPFGTPHALGVDEIKALVAKFKKTAQNAQRSGADGIEILSGNGYLLDQFLHDNINQRTDEYGGSVENRARFALEVVDAVAEVYGYQKIGVRVSPFSNYHETDGSQPLKQLLYLAQQLAIRGVAYIHVREPHASGTLSAQANVKRLLAKGISAEDISLSPFRALLKITPPGNAAHNRTVLFGAGGYTSNTAILAVEEDRAEAVVFGRQYVSNPDLLERVRKGYSFTDYDRSTFYAHGPAGYITYRNYGEENTAATATTDPAKNADEKANPRKRVAIVGAGVSGILSVYAFQRLGGFDLQVFEQKAKAGGSWAYDEVSRNKPQFLTPDLEIINAPLPRPAGDLPTTLPRIKQNRFVSSPLYKRLQANVPYNVMSDGSSIEFPRPKLGNAPFLQGSKITEALSKAALKIQHVIKYNTTLERVDKLPGDRLNLLLRTENGDGTDTWYEEEFDHLIVASGHNAVPVVPKIPGIASWTGGLQHSTTWRSGEEFKDKTILIVGTSESGTDITLQSRPFAKQPIYVSQRTVNPRHPDILKRDGITVVTTISHFDGDKIYLTDDTVLSGIDTVLFATGYAYTYPFFPADVRPPSVGGVRVPGLYQHVFDIYNQKTVAFVGIIQGELTWLAWEKTAFVIALLWSGRIRLPPLEEQKAWEARRLAEMRDRTFHVMLEGPFARVLYYELLNVLARDYLEDPTSLDDILLRSFPFEWVLALQAAIPEKEKFYTKGVYEV